MNKSLLIGTTILIVVIAILGWKIKSVSTPDNNEAISLSTNPSPLQLGQNTFVISVKGKDGKK